MSNPYSKHLAAHQQAIANAQQQLGQQQAYTSSIGSAGTSLNHQNSILSVSNANGGVTSINSVNVGPVLNQDVIDKAKADPIK